MKIQCTTEAETLDLAMRLAQQVKPPFWIYLSGPLGAGKTTFTRGFLKGLGYEAHVKSPTYTLVESYHTARGTVYHFDLYRLEDPEALEFIGIRDYFSDPQAIGIIEWPEHAQGLLPACQLTIRLDFEADGRIFLLTAEDPGAEELLRQI